MNKINLSTVLFLCILFKPFVAIGENGAPSLFVVPEISKPPGNAQTMWYFYKPTKYIHIEKFDIHVFGTETVSDWMMRESSILIYHMVDGLKRRPDQRRFRGHQAFIITDSDPDLAQVGGVSGQRNTGGKGYSVFNEALVCTKAVDTIRPHAKPVYRAWNTPVHEFGHAIEHTLELEGKSDKVFERHEPEYAPELAREYFAWATELWFSSDWVPSEGRNSMPKWKYEYFSTIFDEGQEWLPSQEPRKQ